MAWERRGRTRYYYQSSWSEGRCLKRYVGRGTAGQLAARLDDEARYARQEAAQALQDDRRRREGPESALAVLDRMAGLLEASVLLAAGFDRPNGSKWRRRREPIG